MTQPKQFPWEMPRHYGPYENIKSTSQILNSTSVLSTVTPEKLPTFSVALDIALISELFPTLGCPANAMVIFST